MVKRLFDLAGAILGLLLLAPLLLAIAVAVKLSSPGPVLFRQVRVGRHFRPFSIYKFRTMNVSPGGGPLVTAAGDARVTPFGRFLRQTKIDELPQLFNVLAGDMSFVGPRPEVPEFVRLFEDDYRKILAVRPGITDEASLMYRNEELLLAGEDDAAAAYVRDILPRKIALAKRYAADHNLAGDLKILCRTLKAI